MQKHTPLSNSTRSDRRNRCAGFARDAVFAEFRARDAKAILDVDFIDRAPGDVPRLSPEVRFRSPIKGNQTARRMKSRPARWSDAASNAITALEEMQEMQFEYQDWLDNLPDNLRESEVAEKLEIITGIDFDSAIETVGEANDADLPLGFGRD